MTVYTFENPDAQPRICENGSEVASRIVNHYSHSDQRKIPMIKVIFQATGAGLKASKDVWEEGLRQYHLYGTGTAEDFLEGALFGLSMQVKNPGLRARQQMAEQTMEMDR